ncbi:hypothetical protein GIB67_017984 [Kingdonia uniflora]|uniref:Uncharacterized protein n=1 Tax=Kingdonia uniflora TaxID=39325 RepID=A0A7J7NWM5_9MAGN|nr:hypothetical protein GIB67_017984 [Kingdonia uniflora]
MVKTRSQTCCEGLEAKLEELKARYFGQQSLVEPTPIPMKPTYQSRCDVEANNTSKDFFWFCQFHYIILAEDDTKVKCPSKDTPNSSHRKRLISEREDLSHLNFNKPSRVSAKRSKTNSSRAEQDSTSKKPPRVPAKKSKTNSSRAEKDSASESVPQVAVTPEEVQDFKSPSASGSPPQGNIQGEYGEAYSTTDSQASISSTNFFYDNEAAPGKRTIEEEGIREDNNNELNESEEDEYGPMDTSLLTSFETHRAKALALGTPAVYGCFTTVLLGTLAEGAGISLSLVKMVDFFTYKIGRSTHDPDAAETSSSFEPMRLSSRTVVKAYMLYVITWSWGAATLTHLYYSLGASSRVNVRALACYTTLLESWIFEHFSKLPEIPKPNDFRAPEYFSFTKLCPGVINLDENDDGGILGDGVGGVGVSGGIGGDVRGVVGGGVSYREDVEGQNEDLYHLEEEIPNLKSKVHSLKSAKKVKDWARSELLKTVECKSLEEAYDRLQADIQAKQVVDSICEKDFSKTIKKLNDKTLECNSLRESNKKLSENVLENVKLKKSLADLQLQLQKKECGIWHKNTIRGEEDF